MAWTEPRTWIVGEVVTAAMLNTHLRDNLNAIGPHVRIRKPTTESVTSSTTLQNDDHFFFSVAANEIWVIQLILILTGSSAGDFSYGWTGPAGATLQNLAALAISVGDVIAWDYSTTRGVGGGNTPFLMNELAVIGGTAGTVQFQWAQAVSNATATNVAANSVLLAHRVSP